MAIVVLLTAFAFTFESNGQSPEYGQTTQIFPHFAIGGGYTSSITIHNPTSQSEIVTIEMFQPDGQTLSSRTVPLSSNETETIQIDPPAQVTVGWARLSSKGRFSATLLYQLIESGRVVAEAGVLPAYPVQNLKVIATVRSAQGIVTGLALANPSATSSSNLTVRRLSAGGTALDTRTLTLRPLQQVARLLNEDPLFRGIDNYDGMVEISATQPIVAVSLRLDAPQFATMAVLTPEADELTTGSVTAGHLADAAVTAAKIAPGAAVKSINSLKDDVTLVGGSNITITSSGNSLMIAGTGSTAADTEAPIGTIVAWAGPAGNLPSNWSVCDGRRLSKRDYQSLFDKIGTSWGGDGAPNFYLPDLRGMFLRGVDRSQEGVAKGEDPESNDRLPFRPPDAPSNPGNGGNAVGSFQRNATAQPASGAFTTDTSGNHTHLDPTWNGLAGRYELATINRGPGGYDYGDQAAPTSGAGAHAHSVLGGDPETRPRNAYVYWIIRVR